MSRCHQRSAESIVFGAIQNGGLYIKLGQGLCAFNHILPQEYVSFLRTLEDQALRRGYSEVRGAAAGRSRCRLQQQLHMKSWGGGVSPGLPPFFGGGCSLGRQPKKGGESGRLVGKRHPVFR